jgi:predicted anti-sigma-YlaC factor YlaD
MNHQPFETWILSDETLSSEQIEALRGHLKNCESCRILSSNWPEVRGLFQSIPQKEPAPGFVNRWQARLAEDRLQEERRRDRRESLWMFVLNAGGAAVLFLFLVFQIWYAFGSPTALLFASVYQLTAALTTLSAVGDAITTVISTVASVLPPIYLVAFASLFALLSLIWILSLRKLMLPRRITR